MSETYQAVTRGIGVRVTPTYLPTQSDPGQGQYFWAYTVEIENRSDNAARLISRHWIITDAQNRVEEVRGPGVVGEQPTLRPGESFTYTSGCPLATPSGAMRGAYQMIDAAGREFDVEIPLFSLHLPDARRRMN